MNSNNASPRSKMDYSQKIEEKLVNDRNTYFRGTARIKFQSLHFVNIHDRKRDDEKLIKTLKEKFKKPAGCLRLEPKNHIPAVIAQETLDHAIRLSPPEANQNSLLNNPEKLPPELRFPPDVGIKCLQGRLRVEAAKQALPRKDWWWTIDLYLKGLEDHNRQ